MLGGSQNHRQCSVPGNVCTGRQGGNMCGKAGRRGGNAAGALHGDKDRCPVCQSGPGFRGAGLVIPPGPGGLAARPGPHPGHAWGREGRSWCGPSGSGGKRLLTIRPQRQGRGRRGGAARCTVAGVATLGAGWRSCHRGCFEPESEPANFKITVRMFHSPIIPIPPPTHHQPRSQSHRGADCQPDG